jgi:hypothetical protein
VDSYDLTIHAPSQINCFPAYCYCSYICFHKTFLETDGPSRQTVDNLEVWTLRNTLLLSTFVPAV